MEDIVNFLIILIVCIIVFVFSRRINMRMREDFQGKGTGYCGPDWKYFNNQNFIKRKCIPNMNPEECKYLASRGDKCGANYMNWEQYECKYHHGEMSNLCKNDLN